ncbi:restriction endonuclease subunit S [Edwardsiella ictaluri]|uniref:restriction endonuclease subunit S n=1 Tax=Edwardsiella ictaluri TaxID=67780 RepID=UPI00065D9B31|nr:restriction endonuclease subunit S [Edwardsiella ictaluri]KMQ78326.1 restriction endonuclease subunit S [Edwardsiella ictaluri]KOO55152.1 restriction endonuclease subunit S [Edwardsiella ictaluri]
MMTLTEMPKYDTYKNSGVEWIGDIPAHWNIKKLKYTSNINNQTLPENTPGDFLFDYVDIGSVTLENGIEKVETFLFSDAPSRARRLAKQGDTVVSTVRTYLKAISYVDKKSSEYIYSTGFAVINPKDENSSKYLTHFIKSDAFTNQVDDVAKGISYPAINSSELSNLLVVEPSTPEKNAIADFLDEKTAKIDDAIAIKEQQIALLNERKQILIQQAVTQGLDPSAPMKNSGVAWIGKIPEHWQVKRLKFVLDERSERSLTGEEPLFMVSQQYGLVVRADYHEKAVVAASNIDSKVVYKNDLVFNKLKAHLGVFFKSNMDFKGLVSPDYAVYKIKDYISDTKILELLFRNPLYIEQFTIRATGVVEGLIRLYTSDLFDISIPIAPKEEQLEILSHIEKMSVFFDKAIEIHRDQCEKLKEYKTTLINSAVTGKIKVV